MKRNIKINRGKAQLEVNEDMIGMRIDEALEFRKSGEDELANASMLAATKLLKQRKDIIANMGFEMTGKDRDKAKSLYSGALLHGDVAEKLRILRGSEGKWGMLELEDKGYRDDLTKAWDRIQSGKGDWFSDATENTSRKYRLDNPTIFPKNAIGIESAPNTGLGAALVNQTQQKIMGMPQTQNATDQNGNVLAINQPINSVTNNTSNTTQGRGDSRINEPALNQSRNDDRSGLMF